MERRKPPEDKRRAIENLLSRDGGDATVIRRPGGEETGSYRVHQRSFELEEEKPKGPKQPDDAIEHDPFAAVEDEPVIDEYAATGFGGTAGDDEDVFEAPVAKRSGGLGARNAIILAVAILFIGGTAAALILAREQIMSLFTGDMGDPAAQQSPSADGRIAELEQENADLRATLENGDQAGVELSNLRSANASLQQTLEKERERADDLQRQLDTFKNADPEDNPELANAQGQVEKLTADLEAARRNIADLQQKLDDANARMVSYTRENSRLSRELEDAKQESRNVSTLRRDNERLTSRVESLSRDLDSANSQINVLRGRVNENQSSNEQLTSVNNEYRRVLDLLKESRESNNHKQDRIDELLAENGSLREQVTTLQRSTSSTNTRQASLNTSSTSSSSSATTREPRPTDIVRPEYPDSALRRKVAGTVELRVLISEQGTVLDAQVVRSPDPLRALDRAALSAVRKWHFSPALRDGKAVRVWHNVPMEFTLNRED